VIALAINSFSDDPEGLSGPGRFWSVTRVYMQGIEIQAVLRQSAQVIRIVDAEQREVSSFHYVCSPSRRLVPSLGHDTRYYIKIEKLAKMKSCHWSSAPGVEEGMRRARMNREKV
jgi:dTDP-D-glucose 4,6-dehydratase